MDLSSQEITEKIISGDESSFGRVYQFFFPRLSYFAKQYLLDPEAGKSVAQDVFTELWDKRQTLNPDTNLQAWLFTVTKNKSLKYISHLKSQQNYINFIQERQLQVNYLALNDFDTGRLMFDELQNHIRVSLEKLSPSCRRIFEMSRFEEKKNKEIAEELNLSIKTVEAQITKAIKLLKTELKDYLPIITILFFLPE